MIEARAPDGTSLRFPDNTPDDVIDRTMQAHIAGAGRATAAREANSGALGYVGGLGRQALQGLAFGLGDEALAGIQTGAGFLGNYGEALQGERARNTDFREANPIAATTANFGGALALPVAALGRAGLAVGGMIGSAPPGARLVERLMRGGASRGALAGATGGAAAGAGEGEGLEGRLVGAGQGALIGTAAGGALGAGVSAASGVAGRLINATGMRNSDTMADRQILRAFERDGVDPASGRPQGPGIAPDAPDMALVDYGGRNVTGLAAVAANVPGQSMQAADTLMQARRGARPERIASAVDDAFGGGGGTRVMDEEAALRAQRTAQAGPLYAAANAAPAPQTPELEQIMNLPLVQAAMRENLDLQSLAARGGDFQPSQMQMLDAAKRGLDERIAATLDATTRRVIPGRGQENIALTDLRDGLVQQLDAVPEYAAARAAWAGPSQSMDAMAQGQSALRINPDIVTQIAARMSPSDLEFFRLGVGRAITDRTSKPATALGAAGDLLENRQMQRRLEAAIPDPAQRAQFASALQREVDMGAVERAVSPRAGSQTARIQAGMDDMGTDPPGGALMTMLNATRQGGVMGGLSQGMLGAYRRTQGINSNTADSLAARLLSSDASENAATLARLLQRRTDDTRTALSRALLGGRISRATGAAASLEAQD